MRVDFYQLAAKPVEQVVPELAGKVLANGSKLLLICGDEALLDLLDKALWTQDAGSFLAHDRAGCADPERQPILLAAGAELAGADRMAMLADGQWDDAALNTERVLYLFDDASIETARSAWRDLAKREDVEPRYWKYENGRWREGP